MGDPSQFLSFRKMFRRHLASANEQELEEIRIRVEALTEDIRLREVYLQSIKPENIIKGVREVQDESGL